MMTSPDTLAQTPVEIALSYNLFLGLKPLSSSEALIPKPQAWGYILVITSIPDRPSFLVLEKLGHMTSAEQQPSPCYHF